MVEPRAWLPFQAHHGLVTALISIFRSPCLKPISSRPGLIGKPRPHLHVFELVKESKIMEAALGWGAGGALPAAGHWQDLLGKERGKSTVIRMKRNLG